LNKHAVLWIFMEASEGMIRGYFWMPCCIFVPIPSDARLSIYQSMIIGQLCFSVENSMNQSAENKAADVSPPGNA